ncbi:MAG: flagellar hook-associated protein FlgK [Francisellaceae bacterium]|jgi:flagellar hook-associated protein 1|nr:flagellar hook-associated protein FlgK [Francisellaceae bacterium]MBT6539564.1 flagellar hook-associated protein FlgK [Francisellaceae bacterium]
MCAGITSIGVSGLIAFQQQLATTGHNISNSGTEGYHRQTTSLEARSAVLASGGYMGTGVKIKETLRSEDKLTLKLLNGHHTNESRYDSEVTQAEKMTLLLATDETGLLNSMKRYYESMNELSNDPSNLQLQSNYLSESNSMAQQFNNIENNILSIVSNINDETISTVNEINSLSESIANLNRSILISGNATGTSSANDLKDQRDKLISELSKIITVSTVDADDGALNVFIGTGQALIIGTDSTTLGTQLNSTDPSKLEITSINSAGTVQIITSVINGGKLGGLKEINNSLIEPTKNKLNRLAVIFSMTSNAQHRLGMTQNNKIGGDLFTDMNEIGLQLSRSLADNKNLGTAAFTVAINEISRPISGPYNVFGASSSILDATTLGTLGVGDLTINGVSIRATVAGDDITSTSDASSSAKAITAAINSSTAQTGVTATAKPNSLKLGSFNAGTFTAGQFQINGQNIVTTVNTATHLLERINALTSTTGVRATALGNDVTLVADDGRNIQLSSNTDQPAATFTYFDTNSVVALNKVQRSSVELSSNTKAITISGLNPGDAGLTAGSTPTLETNLYGTEYDLTYDGALYKLTRNSDQTLVYSDASSTINVDGMTITLNTGTIGIGDKYIIKPNAGAARNFNLEINNVKDIASASPVKTSATVSNIGTGSIVRGVILNTTGNPATTSTKYGNAFGSESTLTPPIRIEIANDMNGLPTRYKVFDVTNGSPGVQIGPDQTFVPNSENNIFPLSGVVDNTLPGPNPAYSYDPGYRISINGAPVAGDQFNIDFNFNGFSDNGNVFEMSKMRTEKLVKEDNASLLESYAKTVSLVTSRTQTSKSNYESITILRKQTEGEYLAKVGVNLDEEAAELIRLQQAYTAAARVVSTGKELFDYLISAVSR